MSGVYARFHKATGLEFWDCAVKIETETWRIIKKFPKSARFTHAVPLYQLAQKMNDEICMANSIFATNEHELEMRKDIIQRAFRIMRRKLKAFAKMLERQKIGMEQVRNAWCSFAGYHGHYNSYTRLKRLENEFCFIRS